MARKKLYLAGDDELKVLRIRITNACNAKCRFCGQQYWSKEKNSQTMPTEWLFQTLRPLYERSRILLFTGGEPLFATESYRYINHISTTYPKVNIRIESNGFLFDKKWHELCSKHLILSHFSVNASNRDVYEKGVWETGSFFHDRVIANIRSYIDLLHRQSLSVFAPSISMVINKDTYTDVRDFVKKALEWGVSSCVFYFDYSENDMSNDYFSFPEISRIALEELMKIETVLRARFFIHYRLWIPLKEEKMCAEKVRKIPLDVLKQEYQDLLNLAINRSMRREYEERQKIRKSHGKITLTLYDEYSGTLQPHRVVGKNVCFAPWGLVDICPEGELRICGWRGKEFQLQEFIKNGELKFDNLWNNNKLKRIRYSMLHGNYSGCMACCPLNPTYKPVYSIQDYLSEAGFFDDV